MIAGAVFVALVLTGFFVVSPGPDMPEGATYWYFRLGLQFPLFETVAGFAAAESGLSSVVTEAVSRESPERMRADLIALIESRTLFRLPYWSHLEEMGTDRLR